MLTTSVPRSDIRVSVERRGRFVVRTLTVSVPNLPSSFDGYRMVQITDLHAGPATTIEHLRAGFAIVKDLEPQVLLMTGDYVQNARIGVGHTLATKVNPKVFGWTAYRRGVRFLAEQVGELIHRSTPPDGVLAVFGNHDYLDGLGSIVRKFPPHVKWLKNEWISIKRGDDELVVAGVDDLGRGIPSVQAALNGVMLDEVAVVRPVFRLLLSHNPDITLHEDAALLSHFDLVLCGHTHGGQIRLPFIGPIVTRTKQLTHVMGLSYHDRAAVYTNCGLGYGGIGVRVLCPPEIAVIELRTKS